MNKIYKTLLTIINLVIGYLFGIILIKLDLFFGVDFGFYLISVTFLVFFNSDSVGGGYRRLIRTVLLGAIGGYVFFNYKIGI